MRKTSTSQCGFFKARVWCAFVLCSVGVLLGMVSFAATPPPEHMTRANVAQPNMPLASAAASDWSIVNSPSGLAQTINIINGVACTSASECWAVGYYRDGTSGINQTLIERWDGTSWAIVTSPNTTATQTNILSGVTCTSGSSCWAVGYYTNGSVHQTLIEHWDGSSWIIVTSPNTSGTLSGVTCLSTSDCWAVGYSSTNRTLIERWDGNSWIIAPSPITSGALSGVTCLSASQCWAVGSSGGQTLIERWDGNSWAVASSPDPVTGQSNVLSSVTCTSASDCWAVGSSTTVNVSQTLIERWDGNSWAVVTSPNAPAGQYNVLSGVTCASATTCWAVGYYFIGNAYQTLVECWDGSSWAIVTSPNNGPATQYNFFFGATCTSASNCWAVGYYSNAIGPQTLIERWDGTSWAIATSPNTGVAQDNVLSAVTCTSPSNCWAVGSYSSGNAYQTLIEHWDGISWAIVTSPNVGTQFNFLYSVTCASTSDCWAVGYYVAGIANQTLIEHWDGTSWTLVSLPNSPPLSSLSGVTCVSASNCWAVGSGSDARAYQTLILHWDGTSWAMVTSPNTSATLNNIPTGVTCTSASNCWVVGFHGSVGAWQTLIEHWDGSSWTIVSSPNSPTGESSNLYGVTCTSASDCWAVGFYGTGSPNQTLIERWDGTSWAVVISPNASATQNNILYGVTCPSASNCWAIGSSNTGSSGVAQTLIERWDGSSWTTVPSPNTNASQNNYLNGVSCVSASECWTVGNFTERTLVLKYAANSPPASVVSRKIHGATATFDVDLPLTGTPGVECRSGGASGDYQILIAFPNAVTINSVSVSSGTGSVSSMNGNGTNAIAVNLTGVSNAQTITTTLFGVNDGTTTRDLAIPMSVLTGDTNGDGFVNSGDIAQTKSQSGTTITLANFREDLNTDGFLNSGDISLVKSKSGTALP